MSNLKFVVKITDIGPNTAVGDVFNQLGETYFARNFRFPPKPDQAGIKLAVPSEAGTVFILTAQHPMSAWAFWGSNLAQDAIDVLAKQGIKAKMASRPLRFRP